MTYHVESGDQTSWDSPWIRYVRSVPAGPIVGWTVKHGDAVLVYRRYIELVLWDRLIHAIVNGGA